MCAKHFITGGAGFIGSHLVDRLMSDDNTVTVYDSLAASDDKRIKHHYGKTNFRFIRGELLDFENLTKHMQEHEFVWHFAASSNIAEGYKAIDIDLNSTIGTFNVLKAMHQNRIRKIVFPSSTTVYGEPRKLPTPEDAGPFLPVSLYGAGKLACEGLISAFCHLFDVHGWIFRFGNVVGNRIGRGVIYDFIQKLNRNPEELEILGNGEQEKDFILIEDCLDGIFHAVRNSNKKCDVFNLATETTINVNSIAQIVVEEMGLKNVKLKYTGGRSGWPGDVPQVCLSMEKMRELGWKPKYTSAEAVRITVKRLLGKV